jgi:hypothetical protein
MAIETALIAGGFELVKFIIGKVWEAEESEKKHMSSADKHTFVKGYILAYLEDHDIKINDIDGFISGLISLFNMYGVFIKNGVEDDA